MVIEFVGRRLDLPDPLTDRRGDAFDLAAFAVQVQNADRVIVAQVIRAIEGNSTEHASYLVGLDAPVVERGAD